jgi:hypothetical protein
LWRRLLLWGAKRPESIGLKLKGVLKSIPLLTGMDTHDAAIEFLNAVFPYLNPDERGDVERLILAIPDSVSPEKREFAIRERDQLLIGLTPSDLVVPEAVSLIAFLQTSQPQERESEIRPIVEASKDETSAKAQRRAKFRQLVDDFEAAYKRPERDPSTLDVMLTSLQRLKEAIQSTEEEDQVVDNAYKALVTGCNSIASIDNLSCAEPLGSAVKEILLKASIHSDPLPDTARDSKFDEHVHSWSIPAPRLEAADGLANLAVESTCATVEVLSAIERLSQDPVPAVRLQIARRINGLYFSAPDLMWRIIERFSHEENSRGVLEALLAGPLSRLAGHRPNEIVGLIKTVFDRVQEEAGAKDVRELCNHLFTDLYIWRNHPVCRDIVFAIVDSPDKNSTDVHSILSRFRDPLTHGPAEPPEAEKEAIRHRALDLVLRIIRATLLELRRIESDSTVMRSEQGKSDRNNLYHILHYVAQELYFSSGAYEGGSKDSTLTTEQKRRLYIEAGVHLDELAQVGLPSVAYNVIQTVVPLIEYDPARTFLLIATAVSAGGPWGFQYESLGANLVVSLVERYLAEHRALLKDNQECLQGLLKILDILVQAGWPEANRLVYRLDELYR